MRAVRKAVRNEWRVLIGRKRKQTRLLQLALAASVIVAAFLSLNMLRINGVEQSPVATIGKHFGAIAIYAPGKNSALPQAQELGSVVAGQTLLTGDDAGMGLCWGAGASLRVDAHTRVEFISAEEIYLHAGRVYFDSAPALVMDCFSPIADVRLRIRTDFGEVSHIGTRYMAQATKGVLTVSVRDGAVTVDTAGRIITASRNQQLAITDRGVRGIVNIRPFGPAWEWTEKASPAVRLDGRAVSDFLNWVSAETGLALRYEGTTTARRAHQVFLKGSIVVGPREALMAWMLGTDFEWQIKQGVIYVNEAQN